MTAVWSIYSRRNRGLRHPAKLWLSLRYERRGLSNLRSQTTPRAKLDHVPVALAAAAHYWLCIQSPYWASFRRRYFEDAMTLIFPQEENRDFLVKFDDATCYCAVIWLRSLWLSGLRCEVPSNSNAEDKHSSGPATLNNALPTVPGAPP